MAERSQTTGFGQFGLNAEASYHFGRHFLLAAKLGIDAPVTRWKSIAPTEARYSSRPL
ncbi:MAG: hypothetical protein WDO74_25705 [Pseudomonadota bacterium]